MGRHWPGVLLLALHCGVAALLPPCSAASPLPPPIGGDASALLAFKRAVIEDPHSALADWTDADGDACDWRGVVCSSPHGSVVSLRLSNASLKGFIAPELGQLIFLQELYLDHNLLFGTIPKQLGSLRNLRVLDLGANRLAGPIPPELSGLNSVSVMSSFQGNCLQDDYSIRQRAHQICASASTAANLKGFKRPASEHKHNKVQQPTWLIVLEIATGALLLVFVITAAITASRSCNLKPSIRISSWSRSKSWSDEITVLIDSDMLKSLPKLSRQELEVACEDFSNIIGSTPETVVYKGTMKDGPEVSVISLCAFEGHWTSQHELFYQNKVIDLARLNHENIAKFLGYCRESDPFSRMLVFEYASNGTLYEHLHYGEAAQFSWLRRMKIAIGIAQGLRYLHTESQPPFAISELTSNSVYVTEDFTPKLVDFECWKMLFSRHEKALGHFNNKASFPSRDSSEDKYMDIQGNTFAFGVILLEIISGRLPYCKDKGYLVDWAVKYLQQPEEIGKLVDPELTNVRTEDLAVICSVVSRCVDPDPSKRPSMQIIAGALETGIDLSAAGILKESSLAWAELALSL
ncbi:unnamed protein product [Triticum turgidum subsp. durum]|uniref:Protein kinase domain-containing protein n=1 Tax=Triticum turgidum subsp. durum TaxID=4567 RepID=A0A9R1RF53_TRITD|nr:unnamed protein product [Triticum turgidum subsp. durum]